jgi:L-amino acid N-acyltransferase YncA
LQSTATISAAESKRASTTAARRSRRICTIGARTCAATACRILVATCSGEVVGYAYVVLFRKRPAYRYAVKHSIYVHHEHLGRSVGGLLMQELIDTCAAVGFRQMIGYIDADNTASLAIHEKFGFRQVGLLPGVAYRYGRWADTIMVQRSLAAGSTEPPLISSFGR